MSASKVLAIPQTHKKTEVKNPLTKEQVKWVQEETSKTFAGAYLPKEEIIQQTAEILLKQGKTLNDVLQAVMDDF